MINQVLVNEIKSLIVSGEAIFVDIRDKESFARDHIPGAVNIDNSNIERFIQSTDKSKTVVCYCYHGISSLDVAGYFLERGFSVVYSLAGGFEAWESEEAIQ